AGAAAVYLGGASGSLFAAGTAALAGGGTAMTAGVAVGSAMVGAAVGSAASQLAGKAMGVVDHFSWSQVGVSALTAGVTAGVGGAFSSVGTATQAASQSSWVRTATTAIKDAGWAATGAAYGVINYGSNYVANQIFGNKQSFSWTALGSSVAASMAASGLGASGVFDGLGEAASPYAYALAGANTAAMIEDKWFGGARPDYLNVSVAAIANTVGRQFGERAPTTTHVSIYNENAFQFERTAFNSEQPMYGDASRSNGAISDSPVQLEKITVKASVESEALAGVIGENLYIEDGKVKGTLYTIRIQATRQDHALNGVNIDRNITYALGGVNSTYNM
ncbi:MAG: hypothetical protein RSB25_23780, partial [Acinetobacter sp.]